MGEQEKVLVWEEGLEKGEENGEVRSEEERGGGTRYRSEKGG